MKVRKLIESCFDFEGPIEEVAERIQSIKKNPEYSNYRFEVDYSYESSHIDLIADRDETEEEQRIRVEKKRAQEEKNKERVLREAKALGLIKD